MSVGRLAVATCWLLAVSLTAEAQPPKVPRIGVLSLEFPVKSGCVDRVRRGLDDLGYVEGRTHILELRWAKDRVDLLPSLAADLVRLKVDVIVASSSDAGTAAVKWLFLATGETSKTPAAEPDNFTIDLTSTSRCSAGAGHRGR